VAGGAIWHRRAEEDLTETYLYIGADCPPAAERFLDAVEGTVRFLIENPAAGRRREFRSRDAGGVRSWAVNGFPAYLIFYRVTNGDVEIIRFIHGARDIPSLLEDET